MDEVLTLFRNLDVNTSTFMLDELPENVHDMISQIRQELKSEGASELEVQSEVDEFLKELQIVINRKLELSKLSSCELFQNIKYSEYQLKLINATLPSNLNENEISLIPSKQERLSLLYKLSQRLSINRELEMLYTEIQQRPEQIK